MKDLSHYWSLTLILSHLKTKDTECRILPNSIVYFRYNAYILCNTPQSSILVGE